MQPRIPVHRPYLGDEELEAVRKVFESRWLGLGALTKAFEEQLRNFLGVRHVIAVNTGTAALHLALNALGLEHGDEVIVPSLSFPSSARAVLAVGARPVFCEVRMDTLNMDIDDALSRVTTSPLRASGESAANVVATIEVPAKPPGCGPIGDEEFAHVTPGAPPVVEPHRDVEDKVSGQQGPVCCPELHALTAFPRGRQKSGADGDDAQQGEHERAYACTG